MALRPQGPIRWSEKGRYTLVAWCRSAVPEPGGPSDPLRWQSGRPLTLSPGWTGVSGDVTGGDYSLVRAVVRPPLTGRAEGGATSGETAQSCAVSSAARARRTRISAPSSPPAVKFGSTLTPCAFHLSAGPRPPRRSKKAADTRAQPRSPARQSVATATVAE